MTRPQLETKSKWAVLKLVRAQSGAINWQPVITFFPKGSIAQDSNADGMDVVNEFIQQGLISETVTVHALGSSDGAAWPAKWASTAVTR